MLSKTDSFARAFNLARQLGREPSVVELERRFPDGFDYLAAREGAADGAVNDRFRLDRLPWTDTADPSTLATLLEWRKIRAATKPPSAGLALQGESPAVDSPPACG